MIAIFESYRAGLLVRANLARNVVAGVIVGIVALPLAMACAVASGARPEQGLYTAIVAGLQIATLMAGIILLDMGVTSLGSVIKRSSKRKNLGQMIGRACDYVGIGRRCTACRNDGSTS